MMTFIKNKYVVVFNGVISPSVTAVSSIVLKNITEPKFIKWEKNIINSEMGYLKKYFLFKQ